MNDGFYSIVIWLLVFTGFVGCTRVKLNVNEQLKYCELQASKTLSDTVGYNIIPRSVDKGSSKWNYVAIEDWTSGFWSGILWNLYEVKPDSKLKLQADSFTMALSQIAARRATNHDLGFMMYTSFGNGYRITHNPVYKQIILRTADTLGTLFNPKVGTILSWPAMVKTMGWPHNTIIDNMMNLELLFWAAKNGKHKFLYNIAEKHAETTMRNHFRPDFSSYHVIVYDTITGKRIKGLTHQGFGDETMWARGQSWAIYGFTMCYRETKRKDFLEFAQKCADIYIKRLPADYIPYWDFDAPGIPNEPRDASAAAVTASALLEMSVLINDKEVAKKYRDYAVKMLTSLSSDKYLSGNQNHAFLLHSTGHKPANKEMDASIIYADYYYLEALIRLKKIEDGKSIYENL
jgi:unsaturated chondroitin disaccharide hydrolase